MSENIQINNYYKKEYIKDNKLDTKKLWEDCSFLLNIKYAYKGSYEYFEIKKLFDKKIRLLYKKNNLTNN
jgi:hypothetical protein